MMVTPDGSRDGSVKRYRGTYCAVVIAASCFRDNMRQPKEIFRFMAVEHCVNIMWTPLHDEGVASLLGVLCLRLTKEHCRMYGKLISYVTTMSSALKLGDALWKEHPCTQIINSQFVGLILHCLACWYNFNTRFRRFLSCTSTAFDAALSDKQTVMSFPYHLARFVAMLSLLFRCVCFEGPHTSPSRQTVHGGRTPHIHTHSLTHTLWHSTRLDVSTVLVYITKCQ